MNRDTGFVPTVTGHRKEGDKLILETLDSREETDLYTSPLERVGETLTEEQQEKLALRE
jgi:hypothetical protein